MIIYLSKFGSLLSSRQFGREAFLGFQPILKEISSEEIIVVDFSKVSTFTPAWGDEFLSPLQKKYPQRLFLLKTANPSVKATMEILEETNEIKFNWKN